MRRFLIRPLATAALLLVNAAQATDLLDVWRAASQHDPVAAIAQAERLGGDARRAQARALWRPAVVLSGTAGVMSNDTRMTGAQFSAPGFGESTGVGFGTSVHGGTSTRLTLQARQPLWNPERVAQSQQLNIAADAADLAWQVARQDLMLASAQRYFDLSFAHAKLVLLQKQKAAVDSALIEAKDRFSLGDKPITDTHEAAARAQGLQAQVLAAQTDLELARHALADTTGMAASALVTRSPASLTGVNLATETLADWQNRVAAQNLGVRMQMAQLRNAAQELAKHSPQGGVTVDLVAQAGRDRLSGNGTYGAASNTVTQGMLGVQLNLPLYTGGWRSAKQEEAFRQQEKAQAEVERVRQQAEQQARAVWMGLQTGQASLLALQEAHKASQARLDATRLGRQVGDRTTLDLLQAENDASAAELSLLQARSALLMGRLRLQALAGQLDEAQLDSVNTFLQP